MKSLSCEVTKTNVQRSTRLRQVYGAAGAQHSTLKNRRQLDRDSIERYASRMHRAIVLCALLAGAIMARAEAPGYFVFISNERSGDITVIDGGTDAVVASIPVGKRPRGIRATPDGTRVFVTLSGSPRVAAWTKIAPLLIKPLMDLA
jgi:YVTN family beta-propeller protein